MPLAVFNGCASGSRQKSAKRINRSLSGFSGISINWLACQNSANGGNSTCWLPPRSGSVLKRFQPLQLTFSFRKPPVPPFSQRSLNSAKHQNHYALHSVAAPLASWHPMLITVITGHGGSPRSKEVVAGRRYPRVRRRRPEAFREESPPAPVFAGTDRTIGILMMSKVRTARPPDKTNMREMSVHPVVLICATRVFQCFDDAGNRDFIHRIAATRQAALRGREHRRTPRGVTTIGKMVRETKTAAGCADLPDVAAGVTIVQCFCSPNCWRCIPQPAVGVVVFWWKRPPLADFAALTPQISAPIRRFSLFRHSRPANKRRRRHDLWCNAPETLRRANHFPPAYRQCPASAQHRCPCAVPPTPFLSPKKSTVSDRIE